MADIFFFDIDNTLLDHLSLTIPESALNAIEQLKQAGKTVAIATGRSYDHALPYIQQVKPHYCVTQNGARVFKNQQIIAKTPLNAISLAKLFAEIEALGFHYGAIMGDVGHVSGMSPEVLIPLESVQVQSEIDPSYFDKTELYQAWMFIHEQHDAVLSARLLKDYPEFDFVRWHETAMDVMPKGINKLKGCQQVLQDAGFSIEQAIGFGDGLNDLEMLSGLGLGIAVGDAHPKLLAVADRQAAAPHEDGIAKMLQQLKLEGVW